MPGDPRPGRRAQIADPAPGSRSLSIAGLFGRQVAILVAFSAACGCLGMDAARVFSVACLVASVLATSAARLAPQPLNAPRFTHMDEAAWWLMMSVAARWLSP